MSFESDLRDNTAGPLIAQFGQPAVYRVYAAESYDNATGKTTKGAPTDTPIVLLDLPLKDRDFSEDVMAQAKGKLLCAGQQFAAAGVSPQVNEVVIFQGREHYILAINPVGPAGEAIIYKMATTDQPVAP